MLEEIFQVLRNDIINISALKPNLDQLISTQMFKCKFKFHCQQQTKLLNHIQDVFSASVTMPSTEPLKMGDGAIGASVWLWIQHDTNCQKDTIPINAVNSSQIRNSVTGYPYVEREHLIKWIVHRSACSKTPFFTSCSCSAHVRRQ